MNPIDIAIVGVGKIAVDQHIPSITQNAGFNFSAMVSPNGSIMGIDAYSNIPDLLSHRPDISAMAICTPPGVRFELAHQALMAGMHVLLEKPPGTTLAEVEILANLAEEKGSTLFCTWHSRHAHCVEKAWAWLAERKIVKLNIIWKEDVRRWHPKQEWVWKAGNSGVFDPGINALSILTHIMPHQIYVRSALLEFPSNCETPIAANLEFGDPGGAEIRAEFDWRQLGPQTWDIMVETDDGTMKLSAGGSQLYVDGELIMQGEDSEYNSIYQRFHALINAGESDVDTAPLRHVADAFMVGKRQITDEFFD